MFGLLCDLDGIGVIVGRVCFSCTYQHVMLELIQRPLRQHQTSLQMKKMWGCIVERSEFSAQTSVARFLSLLAASGSRLY